MDHTAELNIKHAGVCGIDSTCLMCLLLRGLKIWSVSVVQNFPFVGMADQIFRCNLEAVHLGYCRETEMLAAACGEGLDSFPFVYSLSDTVVLTMTVLLRVIYDLGFDFSASNPTIELE